jgi:hypothetical protein
MSSFRIAVTPRPDATPDSSRAAVARCYAYLIERRRLRTQKEGGPATAPNDPKGVPDERVESIISARS